MLRSLARIFTLAALLVAPCAAPFALLAPPVLRAAAAPAPGSEPARTPASSPARSGSATPARPAYVVETGEIAGAKYAIARPNSWNRRVLLLAHGLRAEDRPLVADLAPEHLAYKTLLDEGWLIAKTSYRRNGLIVADAIADLDALRAYIEQRYGIPDRVLLEGDSMGGFIATLIAERETRLNEAGHPLYSGAVAVGAALDIREPTSRLGLSLQPKIPLLFLTNQSELQGPRAYVEAPLPRTDPEVRPMLFRVARDGHVNVNQRERLAALRALNLWLDRGRPSLPTPPAGASFIDVTVAPSPQPTQVAARADGRGFTARVIEVSAIYGNVFLNAQPGNFALAGIFPGDAFQLTARDQSYRVVYGTDFSSVPRGEWVAFPNADGFTWLARNYADAATTARLNLGDPASVLRLSPSN